jgi:hypothetical protein
LSVKPKPTRDSGGSVARNHHFVPQGYLAAFTHNKKRDGKLAVYDVVAGRYFTTKPRNIAAERDFNRVDVDGYPPDFIENQLGDMEGKASLALRQVIDTEQLCSAESLTIVINLVCLLIVRNPRFRRSMTGAITRSSLAWADLLVSTEATFSRIVDSARRDGYISNAVAYEEVKSFVFNGAFDIEVPSETLLRHEFRIYDDILQLIGRRHWSLLISGEGAPDFITCDHPAVLHQRDRSRLGPFGVGTPGTEIIFPISPRHALSAIFENTNPSRIVLKPRGVAIINSLIFGSADRQIYCREAPFVGLVNGEIASIYSAP